MDTFAVDFETYYDKEYSLKTLGVDAYVADDRFDPYLVSVTGPGVHYVGPVADAPWEKISGHRAVAHNARFDEVVYQECVRRNFITAPPPAEWHCTADLSVFFSLPRSLAGASKVLFNHVLDKDVRDKMEGMTQEEARATGMESALNEYAMSDASFCLKIWETLSYDWPDHERRLSQLNRRQSVAGVPVDVPRLEGYLDTLKHARWEAEKGIPWDWSGRNTPLSPLAMRAECRRVGINAPASLAQTSQECIDWENKYGDVYPFVGAMRNWRRANILLKKLEAVAIRLRPDGRFPYSCKYFGAHTGRFSGDGGFNIQNLPRGDIMGVDVRSIFIPPEGQVLVPLDLSQIEARVLLWLARDFETLKQVAAGHSVYEAHAINTMGWDPNTSMDKTSMEYLLAKARVLALGFGCGPARFVEMAKLYTGLVISLEESSEIVKDYRTSNPLIPQFWNQLQTWMAWSVGDTFDLELPSGRSLSYYEVAYDRDRQLTAEITRSERREKFYGGKLTENATQAVARDVFTEGMLSLDDAGIPPLFHVHDEYVLAVDKGTDPRELIEIVSKTPTWLPGCPIGAGGEAIERYSK